MARGSASARVQGPGRWVSCTWTRSVFTCTFHSAADASPPATRVCSVVCSGPVRSWPSSASVACTSEPDSCACSDCTCTEVGTAVVPSPGGRVRSNCGADSVAWSVNGALSAGGALRSRAACSCSARLCQPPVQRPASCAWPLSATPGSAAARPGNWASQRWVRSASVHCSCSSPAPVRGARAPWAWALAPGTVSCICPCTAMAPSATCNPVACSRACMASTSRRSSRTVPPPSCACHCPLACRVLMRSAGPRGARAWPAPMSAVKATLPLPWVCATTLPDRCAAASAECSASGGSWRSWA